MSVITNTDAPDAVRRRDSASTGRLPVDAIHDRPGPDQIAITGEAPLQLVPDRAADPATPMPTSQPVTVQLSHVDGHLPAVPVAYHSVFAAPGSTR